jgi:pimeloyl-ACP methyl ester carboxylesterase
MGGNVPTPRRLGALALAALGVLVAIGVGLAPLATANESELNRTSALADHSRPAQGGFARRVKIHRGRRLYLECRGSGRPTVILEAGTGNNARIWHAHEPGRRAILPAVARFTRVCAYDRPGTVWPGGEGQPKSVSRSDPVAMPRTVRDLVRDLHALLRKAGTLHGARIHGPYVLAGHSFGGIVMRLYATIHPRRVAGLVSIDAQSEWFAARTRSSIHRPQLALRATPTTSSSRWTPAAPRCARRRRTRRFTGCRWWSSPTRRRTRIRLDSRQTSRSGH